MSRVPAERGQALIDAHRAAFAAEWVETVPRKFRPARVTDLAPEATAVIAEWMDPASTLNTITFAGDFGRGKTHAAYAAMYEVAAMYGAYRYVSDGGGVRTAPRLMAVTVTDMLDALMPGAQSPLRFEDLCDTPYLLLDDLGAEKMTDWKQDRLTSLINHRWNDEVHTIVTTNLSADELESRLGGRIADRLLDESCSAVVIVGGPSRRRTAA